MLPKSVSPGLDHPEVVRTNKPGIIVLIDFESCFDRVDHNSIRKTMAYFNFGDNFINMLSLLYSNLQMCTINNGYTSDFLTKTRGSNQGCPTSRQIFNYCSEVMAHIIYNNNQIKGLTIDNITNILCQFADDTSAYLKYELLVLETFTEILTRVENQIGLKVSYDKTTIHRIGSLCDSEAMLYTQKNFKWSNQPIDTLGVKIDCSGEICIDSYEKVLEKLNQVCAKWYNRLLTLHGKVTVVNTLMDSLFVYQMMPLVNLPEKYIKEAEEIIRNFIWSGKQPKIGLYTLQKLIEHGGLKLVDIRAKQKALKIGWIFRYKQDELLLNQANNALSKKLGPTIWQCNLNEKDVKRLFENSFWTEILSAWCHINYKNKNSYQNCVAPHLIM